MKGPAMPPVPPSRQRIRVAATLLVVAFGVLLGLGGYTFYYAHGAAYLSDDPQACVNCHIMNPQYDSWSRHSHKFAATCNDCHSPQAFVPKMISKMRNGWNHSRAFTLQDFPEPIRITPKNASILQQNCLRCHGGLVHGIHHQGGEELSCVHCHRSAGHGH